MALRGWARLNDLGIRLRRGRAGAHAPLESNAEIERQIRDAYRLILGREADDEGLAVYGPRVADGESSMRDVFRALVDSDEFAARIESTPEDIDTRSALEPGDVDVAELIQTLTTEELAQSAEDYYKSNLASADYFFAKPFGNVDELPDYLSGFAHVIATLRPLPGMRVLDFGAGTCWTTRILTQLGCAAIAVDVSESALEMGRRLFDLHPPVGDVPEPEFVRFDGTTFQIETESIDRILCFDALHHVPNPDTVLAEFGRVLRDGGLAAFSEPGPNHSKTPQSQLEMRSYTVIENDVIMADIRRWADAAGFTDLEYALFSSEPFTVDADAFADFLNGGPQAQIYASHVRDFARDRRIFFLRKGTPAASDSRERAGLHADLHVELDADTVGVGARVRGRALVENTGESRWLPSGTDRGAVNLGVHLFSESDELVDRDFARCQLPAPAGVGPGDSVEVPIDVPAPDTGSHVLEFDLVAEGVAWFELEGTKPQALPIKVLD